MSKQPDPNFIFHSIKMNPNAHSRITIATVTYNASQTLERTLQSIASQTYPHIEHLIIDGCSKDNTLELIHKYVEQNCCKGIPHEIRLINEPDKGLYDAMNKAIGHAKGEYICFLNAGDKLHSKDTIQKLAENINQEHIKHLYPGIIYGETDIVDQHGNFIRHRRLQAPETLTWKSFRNGMLVCHQSFYVRTELARQETYHLDYRFSADFDWCIRLMKRCSLRGLPIHNAGIILTDYLSEGITTNNHRASLLERFRIMVKHYGAIAALTQHIWFVFRALLKK